MNRSSLYFLYNLRSTYPSAKVSGALESTRKSERKSMELAGGGKEETQQQRFDVVVVGAGIMGSCAAYAAAKRGRRVLLLEQFDLLHHLGSSHGESRTFRATYPEPYYPPLVVESLRLWREAESEAGYSVLTATPHFDVGPAGDSSLQAAVASCRLHGIDARVVGPDAAAELFSGAFTLPPGWIGVVTDVGGVIKPTKALAMFQSLAARHGAVLRDRAEVTQIERAGDGGVAVATADGRIVFGRKCIITAGAWVKKLADKIGAASLPIQPLHTTILYWKIRENYLKSLSAAAGFPTFASYGEPYIYGTPSLEFPGLIKIAMHGGSPCDPDRRSWAAGTGPGGAAVEAVRAWIGRVMGGHVESADGPAMSQACMYAMSPDEDFVVDFLGGEFGDDVVVGAGFSGHGFKMGPVIGKILAEMAVDGAAATAAELAQFQIVRFQKDPKGNRKEFAEQDLI
ncbi:probable sarcosine oxidase isoform X1 [Ananas comosus]|uniref:Probable sarcosine oxidase isoform X1 n=1 Tax=Ananas comosus TaxID=4615 RepID=A0A6P5GQ45_ANACO|nr:probable sarcosine oxidase isoform X1 [Ananas comosus]